MRSTKDIILKATVYGFLVGTSLMFTVTFLMAYFNEGYIMVTINQYGEAQIELISLAVFWALSIWYFIKYQ